MGDGKKKEKECGLLRQADPGSNQSSTTEVLRESKQVTSPLFLIHNMGETHTVYQVLFIAIGH